MHTFPNQQSRLSRESSLAPLHYHKRGVCAVHIGYLGHFATRPPGPRRGFNVQAGLNLLMLRLVELLIDRLLSEFSVRIMKELTVSLTYAGHQSSTISYSIWVWNVVGV